MHIYFFRRHVTILNNTAVYAQRFTTFNSLRRLFSFFRGNRKIALRVTDGFIFLYFQIHSSFYVYFLHSTFYDCYKDKKTADAVSFFRRASRYGYIRIIFRL